MARCRAVPTRLHPMRASRWDRNVLDFGADYRSVMHIALFVFQHSQMCWSCPFVVISLPELPSFVWIATEPRTGRRWDRSVGVFRKIYHLGDRQRGYYKPNALTTVYADLTSLICWPLCFLGFVLQSNNLCFWQINMVNPMGLNKLTAILSACIAFVMHENPEVGYWVSWGCLCFMSQLKMVCSTSPN